MKKIDRDPFSNGTEYAMWEDENCCVCIKDSHLKEDGKTYTKIRCAVQRDIFMRMMSSEPIAQRSYDACQQRICPYRKTEWPKRKKKVKTNPNQLTMF